MGQRNGGINIRPGGDEGMFDEPRNGVLGDNDEDNSRSVAIDLGSGTTKIGFCGEDAPTCRFPTVLGRKNDESEDMNEYYVGDRAIDNQEILKPRYPIKHGFVTNWDDTEAILRYSFEQLEVKSEDVSVLVSNTWGNPKRQYEKLASVMFENFRVTGFYLANQGVMSLYSFGRTTGHVVTVGDGIIQNVPIYEGYCLPHAINRLNFGGIDVTEALSGVLKKNGMERFEVESFSNDILAKQIKEDCCYVSQNYDEEKEKAEKKIHSLPDGSELTIEGEERYKAPEMFFRPTVAGFECDGLQEYVHKSIMKCDVDIQPDMFRNVALSGGSTLFPGFKERMQLELEKLVNRQTEIVVHEAEERRNDCWIGLSILGSLSTFSTLWMTKKEYDEAGPSLVHRKFFL